MGKSHVVGIGIWCPRVFYSVYGNCFIIAQSVCMDRCSRLKCQLFPGTDPEDVIRNAFACFDEEGTGKINEDRLRELLTTMGDRFTDAEVNW